jgi:hypothetical protein
MRRLVQLTFFACEGHMANLKTPDFPAQVQIPIGKIYLYLTEKTLKKSLEVPPAIRGRGLSVHSRNPTPPPANASKEISWRKPLTTLLRLDAACTLSPSKSPGQSSLLPFQALSARDDKSQRTKESHCQALPLHPLRFPRAFASTGPAPSFDRNHRQGDASIDKR